MAVVPQSSSMRLPSSPHACRPAFSALHREIHSLDRCYRPLRPTEAALHELEPRLRIPGQRRLHAAAHATGDVAKNVLLEDGLDLFCVVAPADHKTPRAVISRASPQLCEHERLHVVAWAAQDLARPRKVVPGHLSAEAADGWGRHGKALPSPKVWVAFLQLVEAALQKIGVVVFLLGRLAVALWVYP
eukprot:CAMPEP_0170172936 /NCGR_PEP_ID=MMETSP0040_2-20121228/6201_1 /TAXON_ID=641309 /ORGANISM="Lotharella oceanica, Strain CCMP622" /LENGTH=187 /DNA_ID=CAMNT_0010413851 /DNA_START=290 /DNA_END=853 /DNA_ORIENTATION=-